jgi:20S proteasome subunit alpha 7
LSFFYLSLVINDLSFVPFTSIYLVHEDAQEKEFELEMSWIGDETDGLHQPVPKELCEEAERKAKELLENFD